MRIDFTSSLTAADADRRIISGRIVTWNETGNTSAGPTRFTANAIELVDDIRLLREHDRTAPLGRAVSGREHDSGIDAKFRIAGTSAGTDALVEASEMLRDGLSVGVDVIESHTDDDGTLIVTAARLDEVSLVAHPAIDSARVSSVAASEPHPEAQPNGEPMNPETVEVTEAEETVEVIEASRPRPIVASRPARPFESAGDYIVASIAAQQGDTSAMSRITAAVAQQDVASNPGIVPTPIVGDLISKEYGGRPLVNASRRLPMPSTGKTFIRPMITQHTTAGTQAAEFGELPSQKMTIDPVTLTKGTFGGALEISFQDRDWTDPAVMQVCVSDLVREYAEHTEAIAAIGLMAGATGTGTLAANATSDAVIKAIYDAAASVNTAAGVLPDTLYASPDQWARLGSLVDASKRPIFPTLAPANAPGTASADSFTMNPWGLRLVVSNHLSAGSLIVGASRYFETFEQVGGALSVTNVTVLSTTIAYYGYFTQFVSLGGAFVKLAP